MKKKTTGYSVLLFLLFITLTILTQSANSQSWSALGDGTNNDVRALVYYNGTIIAGGLFNQAGGTSTSHIASWDGTTWESIGLGINDNVYALTIFNGQLIAAGSFTTAGGINASRIASWNGSSWSNLGLGLNNDVYSLAVFNNQLYAGGNFTNRVSMWNGSSWSTLSSGTNNTVYALASFNAKLYAGGSFTVAGGTPINKIASWNGVTWSALGIGLDDGQVNAFTVSGGFLFVGGTFTSIGGIPVNRIAKWNGTNWATAGNGFNGGVNALHASLINPLVVYAGGDFTATGTNPVIKSAVWNGTTWLPMGSGIGGSNSTVSAIFTDNAAGQVIFGGHFTTVGGVSVNNIAGWGAPVGITGNSSEIPSNYTLRQNYPNPFNPTTKIGFGIPKDGLVKLAVYNSAGKEVKELVNQQLSAGSYEIPFNAENLSSGIYFYKITVNDFTKTKKLILIK